MKPGDAAIIVDAIQRWGGDEAVALGGCRALAAIAEKNREAVTDVDGIAVIAEAMDAHPASPGVQGWGMWANIHLLGNLAMFALPVSETKRTPQQLPSKGHPGTQDYPPGIQWPTRAATPERGADDDNKKAPFGLDRGSRGTAKPEDRSDPALEDRRKVIEYTRQQEYRKLPRGAQWPIHEEPEDELPEENFEAVQASRRVARELEEARLARIAQAERDRKKPAPPRVEDPSVGMTLLEMQERMTAWRHGKGREPTKKADKTKAMPMPKMARIGAAAPHLPAPPPK